MATMKLKLGKGSSFVKSRLQRYPQEDAVWEADFQPISDEKHVEFWLGMVVKGGKLQGGQQAGFHRSFSSWL